MKADLEHRLARLELREAPVRFVVGADMEECRPKLEAAGEGAVAILTGVPRAGRLPMTASMEGRVGRFDLKSRRAGRRFCTTRYPSRLAAMIRVSPCKLVLMRLANKLVKYEIRGFQ